MDKQKQIIVAVVGVSAALLLYFLLIVRPNMSSEENSNDTPYNISFATPEVDEKEIKLIESATKKEIYDEDMSDYDHTKYDSLANNFAFLSKMRGKIGGVPTGKTVEKTKTVSKAEAFKNQLKDLEELGKKSFGVDKITKPRAKRSNSDLSSLDIASGIKPEVPKVQPQQGNYFFGAASATKSNSWQDLVPAETVDQGLYTTGSTVAIRTKKSLYFPSTRITIPKDAVVYGKISFTDDRVLIDVKTYKHRNRLYPVAITTHDFDGREGIHLKTRSFFAIPAKVSKTVLDAALQTYSQQANAFGGGTDRVPLGDIAGVSALNEVSQEIFAKRRVFIPRKYHVWLTVTQEDE